MHVFGEALQHKSTGANMHFVMTDSHSREYKVVFLLSCDQDLHLEDHISTKPVCLAVAVQKVRIRNQTSETETTIRPISENFKLDANHAVTVGSGPGFGEH
ncbi:hypothetical protein CSKR_107537 [Clonorchis sinensis]|nr:hypothetical protein CSKR_107537 [Clonorchis sinensis]